jgi:TonB family protein
MKKFQTIAILILITVNLWSQETILVENKYKGSKQIYEKYYVLKSDKSTKHGEYISYFKLNKEDYKKFKRGHLNINDFIKEKGNYFEGKKNGKWVEYSKPTVTKAIGEYKDGKKEGEWTEYRNSRIKNIGYYSSGKKTGIWNTFDTGLKVSSYDFDNDKKVGIWLTKEENGKVMTRFDYDQNLQLQPLISIDLKYPQKAKEQGIDGIVTVSYQINTDCTITNINIIKSLSPECDSEVKRAVEEMAELLKKYSTTCESTIETKDYKFKLY